MEREKQEAVVSLEAMFQKTESDLNHLTRKLDFELQKTGFSDNQNPIKLIQQISDIKKEYLTLVDETKKVQEAQKEMMDYFHEQLGNLIKITKHLESRTNYNVSETSDELKALEQLTGVPILSTAPEKTSTEDLVAESQKTCSETSKNTIIKEKVPEKTFSSIDFVKSPSTKRKNTTEFMPLTEEEFNQVSNLVRGRAKLEDVNNCYLVLWQYFKEEKNKGFLTTKEMHNMGLRITGATGEAKLKILRSLKLLTLNSHGSAQLT